MRAADHMYVVDSLPISHEADVLSSSRIARELAAELGFSQVEQTALSLAVREVTWNIVNYASRGTINISVVLEQNTVGITIIAKDRGPGIHDIEEALKDGFSTGEGLGLGLPSVRRLMDRLRISTQPGRGTTIIMTKWLKLDERISASI